MRKILQSNWIQLSKFRQQILRHNSYIKSYGVNLQAEGIQRTHGQMRYDENYFIKEKSHYLTQMVSKEKASWKETESQLQPAIEKYISISEKRVDTRQGELPEEYDNYLYYSKVIERDQIQTSVLYRKESMSQIEEVLFDIKELPNLSPVYKKSVQMVKMTVSDDHSLVAVGVDKRNDEQVEFYFKDMNGKKKNNKYLKDRITDCSEVQFMKDNKGVFYVEYDHNRRSCRVKTHTFNSHRSTDCLVYEERDSAYSIGMHSSKDQKYIIITSTNKSRCEVRTVEKETGRMRVELRREEGEHMWLNHDGEKAVCLRDKGGNSYKVQLRYDQGLGLGKEWETIYSCEEDTSIQEIDVFKGLLVLYIQKRGNSLIKIIDTSQKDSYPVKQIDSVQPISQITPGMNQGYNPRAIRYHLDTPFSYNVVQEYDIGRDQTNLLEDFHLLGPAFDAKLYTAYQVSIAASDGVLIPVTLVHKRGMTLDHKNRMLLHVYGFYGLPCESHFNIVNLQALQNGYVLGYAHVRGGCEKSTWHDQGRKENKHKSYSDYVAVAEGLIRLGYTHNQLLAGYGASAGASIIAQTMNSHPYLMQSAVLSMPFVEVLGTLMDTSKPLVVSDHEEFGDPRHSLDTYQNISNICPYENIGGNQYPFVYVVAGEDDFRSPLEQVMKWVKRTRERGREGRGKVYVNILEGGHHGGVGVESAIREQSVMFALLDQTMGEDNQEVTRHSYKEEQYEKVNED